MTAEQEQIVADVLAAFGLGPASDVQPLGGTAARKWSVATRIGCLVVRIRPDEFADAASTRFDHAVLGRLASAGLPVPRPICRPGGDGFFTLGGRTIEVLTWIDGDAYPAGDPQAAFTLGAFLFRFHAVFESDFPPGKEGRPREDHPDRIEPYLAGLLEMAAPHERPALEAIGGQLWLIRQELDGALYPRLPRAVIHGDLHPGNVRFRGGEVAALYDFDYLAVHARARDLSDALMFFASTRPAPLEPDRIRSLTQPFVPDLQACRAVVRGYQSACRLTGDEWRALPWLIRSRWIQMRLRGSRKVAPAEKIAFVLGRFFEVPEWLDRNGTRFFDELRQECR